MRPLSNVQINNFFRNNNMFGGCFSKDDVEIIDPSLPKFYILNMDSDTGPGTHWVLLSLVNPKVACYMDSFGAPPPQLVEMFMKRVRSQGIYNIVVIQSIKSENCGYYCLYCGSELSKGKSFTDLLDVFDIDEKKNEKFITEWAKRNKL